MPLTLAAVGMLYVLFLLSGAGADMLETEAVLAFDGAVDSIFDPWRTTFLTQALLGITQLGDMATLIAVVLVSTGFLWADGRPRLILPLWVCVVGSETATWLGKYGFDRARPEFVTEATALSPAFPSSHAAGALAVYGFVAYALACNLPGLARRFELVYWTAVLILLIAFSRIFLSVHFATDTAAGLLVGGFWLLVGIAVSETRHPARRG